MEFHPDTIIRMSQSTIDHLEAGTKPQYIAFEGTRTIAKGSYVIVSEVTYSYLPIYGMVYDKPILLYRQNFFMPRFGGSITVE